MAVELSKRGVPSPGFSYSGRSNQKYDVARAYVVELANERTYGFAVYEVFNGLHHRGSTSSKRATPECAVGSYGVTTDTPLGRALDRHSEIHAEGWCRYFRSHRSVRGQQ